MFGLVQLGAALPEPPNPSHNQTGSSCPLSLTHFLLDFPRLVEQDQTTCWVHLRGLPAHTSCSRGSINIFHSWGSWENNTKGTNIVLLSVFIQVCLIDMRTGLQRHPRSSWRKNKHIEAYSSFADCGRTAHEKCWEDCYSLGKENYGTKDWMLIGWHLVRWWWLNI